MTNGAFSQYNVYQMAEINGGPGSWVTRTTWGNTVARIVGIGTITGLGPYFGSPPVLMDVYSKDGKLRDGLERLSTAGTYKTWRLIEPPEWEATVTMRSLDDAEIAAALVKCDRRRKPKSAIEEFNRMLLNVPFENKDKAKGLGAKWDTASKKWWIKADDKAAIAKARKLGFTP
jgi:Domain of unknown function (DUF5710)